MQEILQNEQEMIELLPGVALEITALDLTGSFTVVPTYLGPGVTYSAFYSGLGGRTVVGPFSALASVQVSTVGRVSVSRHAPNSVRQDPVTKNLLGADNTVLGITETTPYVQRTATGLVVSGPCDLAGFDCIVAAGNITIHDGIDASGPVVVPATALALGRTEFTWKRRLNTGCFVVLSGAATVNVLAG